MRMETPKSARGHATSSIFDADMNARHETISADVGRRLRKACHYLSDEEFALLVDKIATNQLKSERRRGKGPS